MAGPPLPTELAPFAAELLGTGEVLAYLHLSGHHASTDPRPGTFHKYETSAGGKESEKPLSFEYEVVAVEGANGGQYGQAIVYRPLHASDRYVIAFRAVRAQCCAAAAAGMDAIVHGHPADVDAMLDPKFVQTTWLPAEARVSRGICRHAGSTWSIERGGLQSWLIDECPPGVDIHFIGLSLAGALTQMTALRAVLEQGTALGARAHVLTFGALPWTNAVGRDCYERSLGPRAAHLVTELYQQTPGVFPPAVEPWWVERERELLSFGSNYPREYSVMDPLSNAFAPEHVLLHNTFAIGDPEQPAADPNSHIRADFWHAESVRLRPHTVAPPTLVPRREIGKLMTHGLEDDDQLKIDYLRLHRGRAYKGALTALVRSVMRKRRTSGETESGRATELYDELPDQATAAPAPELEAPTAPAPEPMFATSLPEPEGETSKAVARSRPNSTSPGRPRSHGMMRRNSSKRSLEEMQDINAPLFAPSFLGSPPLGAQEENANMFAPLFLGQSAPLRSDGPLSKMTSHGSISKRLDEINMF